MVIMFTSVSMIHSARDSEVLSSSIFFTLFSITLALGYTYYCFNYGDPLAYLIGALLSIPIAQKLDNNKKSN